MSVGEAYHRGVAVMIAGAPVPGLRDAGRAELDGAERNAGTHEHMPVAAGTDLYVDIFSEILIRGTFCRASANHREDGCEDDYSLMSHDSADIKVR